MDDRPTHRGTNETGTDGTPRRTPEVLRPAAKADAAYLATGEHYAWDDIRAWMLSLATGREQPFPQIRPRS